MEAPSWFRQLKWSSPSSVAKLNIDRSVIPDFTGCYVFTEGRVPLNPGRVLYVGEAAGQSLRHRIATYLVAIKPVGRNANNSRADGTQHKGKAFILESRIRWTDHGVFVRWAEYGASPADIHVLEASLINYLNPAANDRVEELRHPLLRDDERLNNRLIR